MTCSSLALPSAPDNDENVTHRFPLCIFNLNLIITYTCSTNPVMKVSQSVSQLYLVLSTSSSPLTPIYVLSPFFSFLLCSNLFCRGIEDGNG